MSIGSVLLGFALLALVALFVARPLMESNLPRRKRGTRLQRLTVQKEALLIQIQAVDLDYETGKMTEDEYHLQRGDLVAETTDILKMIDELDPDSASLALDLLSSPDSGVESDIEAAISRRRRPVARVSETGEKNFCPQCGVSTDTADKFCANCGQRIQQP